MYTDDRLWSSLPKGAQVWFCGSMDPGGGSIETLGFKTKHLLVHEVQVSCFKHLETSRGSFSAFFWGVVSIGCLNKQPHQKRFVNISCRFLESCWGGVGVNLGQSILCFYVCSLGSALLLGGRINSWNNTGCVVKGGEVEGDTWWLHGKIVHQDGQKERCVIKSHFPSSHHHGSLEMGIAKDTVFLEGARIPVNHEYGAQTNLPMKWARCFQSWFLARIVMNYWRTRSLPYGRRTTPGLGVGSRMMKKGQVLFQNAKAQKLF